MLKKRGGGQHLKKKGSNIGSCPQVPVGLTREHFRNSSWVKQKNCLCMYGVCLQFYWQLHE